MSDQPENAPQTETEKPLFRKLVLGHDPSKIDFDQMAAAAVLRMAKAINAQTEMVATLVPAKNDITDPGVVVIEGVPASTPKVNKQDINTYINDIQSEDPATFMMAQALRGQFDRKLGIGSLERQKQIEFINWVRSQENRKKKFEQPKLALPEEYKVLKDIWYGLKLEYDLPDQLPQLLEKQALVLEMLYDESRVNDVRTGKNERSLATIFREQIEKNQQFKEDQKQTIRDYILLSEHSEGPSINPDLFQLHTTPNGFTVAFIDVRETHTDMGALAVARELAQQFYNVDHVACTVVINNEESDSGEILGTKVLVKVADEDINSPQFESDIQAALAERLNFAEAQYGKGFVFTKEQEFGGHDKIVSTPQSGSGMSAAQLKEAFIDYIDNPRYTVAALQTEAQAISMAIGNAQKQFTLALHPPRTAFESGSRIIRFTIPSADGSQERTVELSETELSYYRQTFKDASSQEGIEFNKNLLLQKTEDSEAPEIKTVRLREQSNRLNQALKAKDMAGVLRILNGFKPGDIQSIDPLTLIQIYNRFSQDSTAVAEIYQLLDKRWSLNELRAAQLHTNNQSVEYQKALFTYSSVKSLLDRDIPFRIHEYVANLRHTPEEKTTLQRIVGDNLLGVLRLAQINGNPLAEHSHHFQSILEYITDTRIDKEVRSSIVTQLTQEFGTESMEHWNRLAEGNVSTLFAAVTMYPDEFNDIFEQIQTTQSIEKLPGIAGSTMRLPETEKMQEHIRAQETSAFPPVLNILVQIDSRDVPSILQQKGITRFTQVDDVYQFSHSDERDIEFDAVVTTPSLKQGGNDRQETAVAKGVLSILEKMEDIVRANPNVQIRLIRGNFTTKVSGEVGIAIGTSRKISDVVRDRIIWCDYTNKGMYEDAAVEKY